MDSETQDIMIYVSIVISISAMVINLVNHKKLRSGCCGKNLTMSLDIDNTSPLIRVGV